MTHHDDQWGILGSQQDEDQSRAKAVNDPAQYHASIASKEQSHEGDAMAPHRCAQRAEGNR